MKYTLILASLIFSCNTYALTVFLGAGSTFGGIDFYDSSGQLIIDNNSVTGSLEFSEVTQSGSGNFTSGFGSSEINVYNANINALDDGSLNLFGQIDIGAQSGLFLILRLAVDYEYISEWDASLFSFSTLSSSVCINLICSGATYFGSIDFSDNPSFLAYVENPFPQYTAVPLPASWFTYIFSLIVIRGVRWRYNKAKHCRFARTA